MTFLVDTGANVTIVKPCVLNRTNASERPSLEQGETSMLLADGSSLPFLGRGRFSVSLGEEEVFHDGWVAEIELDWIIANCRNVRGLGRVYYIDWIENLKISTEMLLNEKLPSQV